MKEDEMYVARIGNMGNAYRFWSKNLKGRELGRPKCRWEDNIRMNSREKG
jgi:hypothetical protein